MDNAKYYVYTNGTTHWHWVTVVSCAPQAWINSSITMGNDMADAMGVSPSCCVVTPGDSNEFASVWADAVECVVVHTHGDATGLYDEEVTDAGTKITPLIITTEQIAQMPKNESINFVMMTACSTASGDAQDNVAYWLSKKINKNGIVIANKYVVSGSDTEFGAANETAGWVMYRDGKATDLDGVYMTMADAYHIYLNQ